MTTYRFLSATLVLAAAMSSQAQLTVLSSFNPVNTGGLCSIGQSSVVNEIVVYSCGGTTLGRYTDAGGFLSFPPKAGENANDVDIDMVPVDLLMSGSTIAQGQILFLNGETGPTEIYAIDRTTGEMIDTLHCGFGASHVVGGAYHPLRQTFFLVQDTIPEGFDGNRIAEIDPITGDTLATFSLTGWIEVGSGDLDVSPVSGNLFVVSDASASIAEFTPTGALVALHPLPSGVNNLSGISIDNDPQTAWVASTDGMVYHLGNIPVGVTEVRGSDAVVVIHPNPATDRISVTIGHAIAGKCRIILRDLLGRETETLFEANLPASEQTLALDISGIPTGTYSIVINRAGVSSTRKLMVIRP